MRTGRTRALIMINRPGPGTRPLPRQMQTDHRRALVASPDSERWDMVQRRWYRPLLGSTPQGVVRDDAGKALDPLQMRDRAVNIRQRLTTRMPSGEQPGDIRTRHAPKASLVLLNNQI
jgi:hypothetical protein